MPRVRNSECVEYQGWSRKHVMAWRAHSYRKIILAAGHTKPRHQLQKSYTPAWPGRNAFCCGFCDRTALTATW